MAMLEAEAALEAGSIAGRAAEKLPWKDWAHFARQRASKMSWKALSSEQRLLHHLSDRLDSMEWHLRHNIPLSHSLARAASFVGLLLLGAVQSVVRFLLSLPRFIMTIAIFTAASATAYVLVRWVFWPALVVVDFFLTWIFKGINGVMDAFYVIVKGIQEAVNVIASALNTAINAIGGGIARGINAVASFFGSRHKIHIPKVHLSGWHASLDKLHVHLNKRKLFGDVYYDLVHMNRLCRHTADNRWYVARLIFEGITANTLCQDLRAGWPSWYLRPVAVLFYNGDFADPAGGNCHLHAREAVCIAWDFFSLVDLFRYLFFISMVVYWVWPVAHAALRLVMAVLSATVSYARSAAHHEATWWQHFKLHHDTHTVHIPRITMAQRHANGHYPPRGHEQHVHRVPAH